MLHNVFIVKIPQGPCVEFREPMRICKGVENEQLKIVVGTDLDKADFILDLHKTAYMVKAEN